MKKLEYVLKNYEEFKTFLEDRFGKRLCQFLTEEEMEKIGFEYGGKKPKEVVEWNEENILKQLKEDVEFGIEKAMNHRGISSELMYDVCISWCKILENGLEDIEYDWYGHGLFEAIDEKYEFGLITKDMFGLDFYKEW